MSAATALHVAFLIAVVCAATIAGAFAFQAAGYAPCELCLKQRIPYYLGAALAVVTAFACLRRARWVARTGFVLLAVLFLAGAALGVYHAGVEWGFWPGPSDCSGALDRAASTTDFLRQLDTFRPVRCDAVAIRIGGLSLAGWNALIALALAAISVVGWRRAIER